MPHALLILLILLLAGCSDDASTCRSDADCVSGESCVGSGGLFFGGRVCVASGDVPRRDMGPTVDAGTTDASTSDMSTPDDIGAPSDTGTPTDALLPDGGDFVCEGLTDRRLCTQLGAECGALNLDRDLCEEPRTVNCGGCAGAGACDSNNQCTCVPETDDDLCTRLGANCGALQAADNCGEMRTVSCGQCNPPATCGGGGTNNVCACADESDLDFCQRFDAECGVFEETDICGQLRTVSCGTCPAGESCTINECVPDADGDGVTDGVDNCPNVSNPNQSDVDGDDVGDVCDNCPTVANAFQNDDDADGRGNACEPELTGTWHATDNNDQSLVLVPASPGSSEQLFLLGVSWDDQTSILTDVSGLGLTWMQLETNCAGQGDLVTALYAAYGVPTGTDVVIQFDTPTNGAIGAVAAFENVDAVNPVAQITPLASSTSCSFEDGGGGTYTFDMSANDPNDSFFVVMGYNSGAHNSVLPAYELSFDDAGPTEMVSVYHPPVGTGPVQITGDFSSNTTFAGIAVRVQPLPNATP